MHLYNYINDNLFIMITKVSDAFIARFKEELSRIERAKIKIVRKGDKVYVVKFIDGEFYVCQIN